MATARVMLFHGPQATRYTQKAMHTKGSMWPLQESCYLRGVRGLTPASSEASRLSSEASRRYGWGGRGRGRVCTLCEWPLRGLLNENANMGVQNNYFVQKRPFSMSWNGGYDFQNSKKKIQVPREKTTPFLHTRWPWWPFNALFRIVPFACVCCDPCECQFGPHSRELRMNLAQFLRTDMHIFTITNQVLFAMNRPNVLCSPFALSETLTKGMYIVEVTKGPLAGPPSQFLGGSIRT